MCERNVTSSNGEPLEGIVYLHGRRKVSTEAFRRPTQLILSSADFGRAYLAQGWATRFVTGPDETQHYCTCRVFSQRHCRWLTSIRT